MKKRPGNQNLIGRQEWHHSLQRFQRAAFTAFFCSQFAIHIDFNTLSVASRLLNARLNG